MSQPLALRASILLADLLVCWGGSYDASGDPLRYVQGGQWLTSQAEPTEWSYNNSPGCAAAQQYAYSQLPRSEVNRTRAVETIDRAINLYQFSDGGWLDYNAGGTQSNDIATYFWGVEMATAYLALKPFIGTRPAWEASLKRSCDFLAAKEVIGGKYYANGNIQIGYVELLELTYLATGDSRYSSLAATALAWAKSPSGPSSVINGGSYGWVEAVVPTLPDGSDGKGYFCESDGVVAPGVDWRYLHLQSAVVSRLYLATGKSEYLRMANMMLGKLMEHVNTTTWLVDLTGGTRLTAGTDPFYTPAMHITAWVGGTTAWSTYLTGVIAAAETTFRTGINSRVANLMRDSSKMLAPIVRAGA